MAVKRKRKIKEAAKVDVEANWARYFANIKGVCPWSYAAFMKETILFVDYNDSTIKTWASLYGANGCNYEAFVYKCEGKDSNWLNETCDIMSVRYSNSEWLWSHPEKGGDSTPIPVIIQQDKKRLEDLREKTGYTDEE